MSSKECPVQVGWGKKASQRERFRGSEEVGNPAGVKPRLGSLAFCVETGLVAASLMRNTPQFSASQSNLPLTVSRSAFNQHICDDAPVLSLALGILSPSLLPFLFLPFFPAPSPSAPLLHSPPPFPLQFPLPAVTVTWTVWPILQDHKRTCEAATGSVVPAELTLWKSLVKVSKLRGQPNYQLAADARGGPALISRTCSKPKELPSWTQPSC